MRLGEALTIRADLQKRIAQLGARLKASSVVQEGDAPPEDPALLLSELSGAVDELERLIAAINRTNAGHTLADGSTLTDGLARRDVLTIKQSVLRDVVDAVTAGQARYSRSEIRVQRQIDVGALRKEIDDLARERRELDVEIQERNWQIDLVG